MPILFSFEKEIMEAGSDGQKEGSLAQAVDDRQKDGVVLNRKLRVLRALFEILVCSGVLTGLTAILILRLAGISEGQIMTKPIYTVYLGGIEALLLLVLISYFLRQHRQNWRDLIGRISTPEIETVIGLSLIPLLLGLNLLIGHVFQNYLPEWHSDSNPLLALVKTPLDLLLFLSIALVAGGFKEELQRAFILQRFKDDMGKPYFGLAVWSLLFGYGHVIQGMDSATGATLFGLLFGSVYLWRKNIVAPIVAHSLYNSLVLVGYWFLGLD